MHTMYYIYCIIGYKYVFTGNSSFWVITFLTYLQTTIIEVIHRHSTRVFHCWEIVSLRSRQIALVLSTLLTSHGRDHAHAKPLKRYMYSYHQQIYHIHTIPTVYI